MPYWEITPHKNKYFDSTIMPAETEGDHRAALEYAMERLEALWDSAAYNEGPKTVTIELHNGEIPELEEVEE